MYLNSVAVSFLSKLQSFILYIIFMRNYKRKVGQFIPLSSKLIRLFYLFFKPFLCFF